MRGKYMTCVCLNKSENKTIHDICGFQRPVDINSNPKLDLLASLTIDDAYEISIRVNKNRADNIDSKVTQQEVFLILRKKYLHCSDHEILNHIKCKRKTLALKMKEFRLKREGFSKKAMRGIDLIDYSIKGKNLVNLVYREAQKYIKETALEPTR
jgi:hypothetical protein